jgi:hypothetical protein
MNAALGHLRSKRVLSVGPRQLVWRPDAWPLADLIEALEARAKPSGPRPHLLKLHSVYPR